LVVGHIAPEAAVGGTIGLLKNGDMITIDARRKPERGFLSPKELAKRAKAGSLSSPVHPPDGWRDMRRWYRRRAKEQC